MEKTQVRIGARGATYQQIGNLNQDLAFYAALGTVILTLIVGAPILNLVVPYSVAGGFFLAKFHPASWIAVLLSLALLTYPTSNGLERHYRIVVLLFALLCIFLAACGKGALMSVFLDIGFTPAVLLATLVMLPVQRTRTVQSVFIYIAAFNVLIVAIEFVLRSPLVPREGYEEYFRPAGLFGHPINSGMLFCCAMLVLAFEGASKSAVRPLMLLFLVGTILCGVRGPLAVAVLIFLVNIVRPKSRRTSGWDYVLDFGILVATPAAIGIAYSVGAFDRVLALGLWEESSQSRAYIFDALDSLNSTEFWWGVDSYERMEILTAYATGGRYIENSFVAVVFAAGLPAAILASTAILYLFAPSLRRSVLMCALFALASFGTITFSTKNSGSIGIVLSAYSILLTVNERKLNAR